jgi:hypothetical protein
VVFARKIDDSLTSLVKKLDKASTDKKINSFVVLMTDDENAEAQLKKLADKNGIKKTVLTIDNPAGPSAFKISKKADVTVLLYNKRTVEAYAFGKGEFNAKGVETVLSGLPKITK